MIENRSWTDRVDSDYVDWWTARGKEVRAPESVVAAPLSEFEIQQQSTREEITKEQLRVEKEDLLKEKKTLSQRIFTLEEEKKDCQAEIIKLEGQCEETNKRKRKVEEYNELYKEDFKRVDSKVRVLKNRLKKEQLKRGGTVERYKELLRKRDDLHHSEKSKMESELGKSQGKNQQLVEENDRLKQQLEKFKVDLESEQKVSGQLRSEKEECQKKILQLEEEKKMFHDKYTELYIEQSLYEARQELLDAKNALLRGREAKAQKELQTLKARLKEGKSESSSGVGGSRS